MCAWHTDGLGVGSAFLRHIQARAHRVARCGAWAGFFDGAHGGTRAGHVLALSPLDCRGADQRAQRAAEQRPVGITRPQERWPPAC